MTKTNYDKAKEFIETYLKVFDKTKQKNVPFKLNKAQDELLKLLTNENRSRIIVLKARQLGISTFIRAWHFYNWITTKEPLKLGVIAHTEDGAKGLHGIDKRFYDGLHEGLKIPITKSNTRVLEAKVSKAALEAYSADAKGGSRSHVFIKTHLSEFAFYSDQVEALAQITSSAGENEIIIESTPNIPNDKFHELILDGLSNRNEWKIAFFPWSIQNEYSIKNTLLKEADLTEEEQILKKEHNLSIPQIAWRRNQIKTLGEEKFKREYPLTVQDAFDGAEYVSFFSKSLIQKIYPVSLGDLEIRKYKDGDVKQNTNYVIGVDTSAGVGKDFSAFSIVNTITRSPALHFLSNQITIKSYAHKVYEYARKYNNAKIIIEMNSYGRSVYEELQSLGYKNIHQINTSVANRTDLFINFKNELETHTPEIFEKKLLDEIKETIYLKDRPDHPSNKTNDLLFSCLLAYHGLKEYKISANPLIRTVTDIVNEEIKKSRIARARKGYFLQPKYGKL